MYRIVYFIGAGLTGDWDPPHPQEEGSSEMPGQRVSFNPCQIPPRLRQAPPMILSFAAVARARENFFFLQCRTRGPSQTRCCAVIVAGGRPPLHTQHEQNMNAPASEPCALTIGADLRSLNWK
jgi:hypothetical protein